MPKNYTFPFLFDEVKSLSITDLKNMDYFIKNQTIVGDINWKMRGEKSGSISIKVTMSNDSNYVDFNYTCNDESYNYRVYVVSIKSNLNKGKILYFQCKFTGKRCRKLHLIKGRFQHRTALTTGMYSKQTNGKKWRIMEKYYSSYFDSEKIYSEFYAKNFRKFYKGKPTKRYLKLIQKLKDANRVNPNDIDRLLLSK